MKKYLSVLILLLLGFLVLLLGLAFIEGQNTTGDMVGEEWCEAMMDKPNNQWTDAETRSFAKACL